MRKVLNNVLFIFKFLLFLCIFAAILYTLLLMKNYYKWEINNVIYAVIPFFLLLIVFVLGFFFHKNDNNFLHITSIMVFLLLAFVLLRTHFDYNMVMGGELANYLYFKNNILIIKMLTYLLFIVHFLYLIKGKIIKKEEIHS